MEAEVGFQLDVHRQELRCRTGWAVDRWEAAIDDILLDIRWRDTDRVPDNLKPNSQPLSAGDIDDEGNMIHQMAPSHGFDSLIATDVMIDW